MNCPNYCHTVTTIAILLLSYSSAVAAVFTEHVIPNSETMTYEYDDGLVAHWKFDETNGTKALDSSGHGNHGTLVNEPVWTGNRELLFDGTDDYVEVPDSNSLYFDNEISISVWIYLNAYGNNWPKVVIKPHSAYNNPWEMYCIDLSHYGDYPRMIITDGTPSGDSGLVADPNKTLLLDKWYHVVGIYDGNSMSLYVNGEPVATQPSNIQIGQNDMPLSIGGRLGINSFNGILDDVRIYDYPLSAYEVAVLAENRLSAPVISHVQASNVTASQATITWNTDEASTSQVEYGLDINYGNSTPPDANLVHSHSVVLVDLSPNTTYYFHVISADESGNESISHDNTFTTTAAVLTDYVIPTSGTTDTTFSYYIHYYDPDGDSPRVKRLYIDGALHTMSLFSGNDSNGIYHYQTTLGVGSHNYYFYFTDGQGGSDRLPDPSDSTISGPTISPAISGRVTVNGVGLAGVTITGLPGGPVTNSNGFYTATVDYGASLIVEPDKAGYTFSPAQMTYSNVSSDYTDQDYTAVPDIANHLFFVEIWVGWDYNEPNEANDPIYEFDLGLETDETVNLVEVNTPADYKFEIPNDENTQSGDIGTWHYVDHNTHYWEYEGKFADQNALMDYMDYGDGIYTITLYYEGGGQGQTTVLFGDPNTGIPIPQPIQEPVLTSPSHNEIVKSPVTFAWVPCTDANVALIWIGLIKQDANEVVDINFPVDVNSSDPVRLSKGMWDAEFCFDSWYDFNNVDGIPVEIGKYSKSGYAFTITVKPSTEIIIDNGDDGTSSTGSWGVSSAYGYYGGNSLYSLLNGASYSFEARIVGTYEISLWWTAYSNRSDAVSVKIYDGGVLLDTVTVNQKVNGGRWNSLGYYTFTDKAQVEILADGSAVVVADAVKFTPATEIIIDNDDPGTSSIGSWNVSSFSDYYGDNSLYSLQNGASYSFEARILGAYEISLWWTANSNRLDAVAVEIYDGPTLIDTITVNQKVNEGKWNVLGYYSFSDKAKVKIISDGSAVVVADAVKFAPATEIIIDNGDTGTSPSGTWIVSSFSDYYGVNSLYSLQNGASYSFETRILGTCEISLWWTAHSNRSDAVSVEIYDGGVQLDTVTIDQQVNGGKWNSLGYYTFTDKAEVKIISDGSAVVVADAVKFTPATEIIIDNGDTGTSLSGTWNVSSFSDYYGDNSLYSLQNGASYSFEARILGTYEISLWWTANSNRSDAVSVEIYDGATKIDTVTVDQQVNGGKWNSLGYYTFTDKAEIKIISGGDAVTITDAVKFKLL